MPTAAEQAPRGRVGTVGAFQGQWHTWADQGRVGELFEEHAGRRVDRVRTVSLRVAGANARLRPGNVRRVEGFHQGRGGSARTGRPVRAGEEDPGVVLLAVLEMSPQRAAAPPEALIGGVCVAWPPSVAPGAVVEVAARRVTGGAFDLLLVDVVPRLVADVEPHPGHLGCRRARRQLQLPADRQHRRVGGGVRADPRRIPCCLRAEGRCQLAGGRALVGGLGGTGVRCAGRLYARGAM